MACRFHVKKNQWMWFRMCYNCKYRLKSDMYDMLRHQLILKILDIYRGKTEFEIIEIQYIVPDGDNIYAGAFSQRHFHKCLPSITHWTEDMFGSYPISPEIRLKYRFLFLSSLNPVRRFSMELLSK